MKGKYIPPSLFILLNNNFDETSYNVSTNIRHVLGTKNNNNSIKKFTNAKLVIEKSKQSNWMESGEMIWNCSKKIYNIRFNTLQV